MRGPTAAFQPWPEIHERRTAACGRNPPGVADLRQPGVDRQSEDAQGGGDRRGHDDGSAGDDAGAPRGSSAVPGGDRAARDGGRAAAPCPDARARSGARRTRAGRAGARVGIGIVRSAGCARLRARASASIAASRGRRKAGAFARTRRIGSAWIWNARALLPRAARRAATCQDHPSCARSSSARRDRRAAPRDASLPRSRKVPGAAGALLILTAASRQGPRKTFGDDDAIRLAGPHGPLRLRARGRAPPARSRPSGGSFRQRRRGRRRPCARVRRGDRGRGPLPECRGDLRSRERGDHHPPVGRRPPHPPAGRGARARARLDRHPAQRRRKGEPVFPARVQPRPRHRLPHHAGRGAAEPAHARARAGLHRSRTSSSPS